MKSLAKAGSINNAQDFEKLQNNAGAKWFSFTLNSCWIFLQQLSEKEWSALLRSDLVPPIEKLVDLKRPQQ
ncbi:hypothetical protein [Mucilaginibacter sp. PPCGB 2223]|uniref:hypothetical protein n=1 Tax=Mucilaginibacter sp. PPCGB 2223 TaxID=1886027 RepID=UPI001586A345|nr:hypothetical protein [Mucilaginibacter sp. PPCGB 2223]